MNIRSVSSWIRIALITTVLMLPGTIRPARADGGWCSYYKRIKGIPVASICIAVYGDGTYIHNMDAVWTDTERCSWRIDWVILYNGKTWWRDNGPVQGCNKVHGYRSRGKGYAPNHSRVCAVLYDVPENKQIDSACADIEN